MEDYQEDFSSLDAGEIQTKIQEIETDPYFFTSRPEGKPANAQYRESLMVKRDKLYAVKFPEPVHEQVFDADGVNITPIRPTCTREQHEAFTEGLAEHKAATEAAQDKLESELRTEVEILEQINPDTDYDEAFDGEATPEKVEGFRCLRLLNQGDVTQAGPLIIQTAESLVKTLSGADYIAGQARVGQLRAFLETANGDSEEDLALLANIVNYIYTQRKGEN